MQDILFYLHSAAVLLFGVFLSAAFSGTQLTRKNMGILLGYCVFSGLLQLLVLMQFSEQTVWYIYPLIVHLPTILFFRFAFRQRLFTAFVSVLSAYLLCQPAKWLGVFAYHLTQNISWEYVARLICLMCVGIFSIKIAAPCFRGIFTKDNRSLAIFGIVPIVYYLYDYSAVVYADFWQASNQTVTEFMPLLLCIAFLLFCMVYYREYEQKTDAERKEQVVQIVVQQQAKQMENVKQAEDVLRMTRHDMRHFLNRLALCIDNNDLSKAKDMLQDYITYIDGTQLTRFCGHDTVNSVLSAFAALCQQENIQLHCDVQLDSLEVDELLFCSILQNALENAYNAQLQLKPERRNIFLMLKYMDGKLLLSVKNPTKEIPVFADGLPVVNTPDHGYGTQSIRYLSERLHGSCQFSCNGDLFILRVVL
ncbi:MAG: sensor histidine kinase [Oscillospiraceae bacterium]|nr:sensor histidine kinase [Oscillospiraceae bacterium]